MRFEVGYKQSPWMRCDCGKIHVVLFATKCPQCSADLNPVTRTCRDEIPKSKTALGQGKYAKRVDMNGVEWKVCDPYPTYYRYEDSKIVMRSTNNPVPFADEKENA